VELAAAAEWIDDEPAAVAREDELAQMDVPVAATRPPDLLRRTHHFAGLDERVDVPVAEMSDPGKAADAAWSRLVNKATFDREDPMRSTRRSAAFRPIITYRDVHPAVVDGADLPVRPRIQERAAHGMLPRERQDRPAAPSVVVALKRLQPTRDPLRHRLSIARASPSLGRGADWRIDGKLG